MITGVSLVTLIFCFSSPHSSPLSRLLEGNNPPSKRKKSVEYGETEVEVSKMIK
jgi:hypothetical protein